MSEKNRAYMRKYMRKRRTTNHKDKKCDFCGSGFVSSNNRQRFCSFDCRTKEHAEKRKEKNPYITTYNDETLDWFEQRTFENCCRHHINGLRMIHIRKYHKSGLCLGIKRKMRELGILVPSPSRIFGRYSVVSDEAIKLLGFKTREIENEVDA